MTTNNAWDTFKIFPGDTPISAVCCPQAALLAHSLLMPDLDTSFSQLDTTVFFGPKVRHVMYGDDVLLQVCLPSGTASAGPLFGSSLHFSNAFSSKSNFCSA